jgi:nitrate/TMAO reductase-like tetraheme cytochrome c subunit
LRRKADAVVLLAFTDEATLAKLAQEFYELDIVLGGKVSQPAQKLERENKSLVYYTANEGRALGLLELRLASRRQLTATKNDIMLLHDEIPQAKPVQALAAEYRDEIRRTKLAVDDPARLQENMVPGVRQTVSFTGSDACAKCHATAFKAWKSSSHADAFATLVHEKADADPNCIGCHTVGFGTPSGYRREFGRSRFVDVGCESCHGPGSQHVAQHEAGGAVTFKFRPLGAGDCQKCHHGEFSRPFVWDKFWPKVAHGKEPVKAAARDGGPK